MVSRRAKIGVRENQRSLREAGAGRCRAVVEKPTIGRACGRDAPPRPPTATTHVAPPTMHPWRSAKIPCKITATRRQILTPPPDDTHAAILLRAALARLHHSSSPTATRILLCGPSGPTDGGRPASSTTAALAASGGATEGDDSFSSAATTSSSWRCHVRRGR